MDKAHRNTLGIYALAATLIVVFWGNFALPWSVAGIVVTPYRAVVPLAFVIVVITCRQRLFEANRFSRGMLALCAGWFVYACGQLAVHHALGDANALREVMNLVLGMMMGLMLVLYVREDADFRRVLQILRIDLVGLLVLATVEITVGWHLPGSMIYDPARIALLQEFGSEAGLISFRHTATGVFFNPNDFSACLVILAPLLLPGVEHNRLVNGGRIFGLVVLFSILLRNDSWICIIALMVGAHMYLLFKKAKWPYWLAPIGGYFAVQMVGYKVYLWICGSLAKWVLNDPWLDTIRKLQASIGSATAAQVSGVEAGSGSLFMRLATYQASFVDTLRDTYGLGYGPWGLSNHLQSLTDPDLLKNPHSFWVELFGNYGILVTVGFLVLCLGSFVVLWRHAHQSQGFMRGVAATILTMDLIFVLASNAPSSFIGYGYYWIVIGVSVAAAITITRAGEKGKGSPLP